MKQKTPRTPKNFSFLLPPLKQYDYAGRVTDKFRWKQPTDEEKKILPPKEIHKILVDRKTKYLKILKRLKKYATNHHRHGFKKLKKEFLRAGEWTKA